MIKDIEYNCSLSEALDQLPCASVVCWCVDEVGNRSVVCFEFLDDYYTARANGRMPRILTSKFII
ncbi:hypothetical protein [Peromfec virus RodF7_14]|uniref:Uncharacterized protein n=1 Tax=Peromfec virus RodF7_14 TaxID=2929349 RepID=A0A976N2Q5_9VIRU|nr:hypothetical protein [Peromfec virus RodF7_14]